MSEIQDANDKLALMGVSGTSPSADVQKANEGLASFGVKLSPLAELYADLHKAYMELAEQHVKLFEAGAVLAEAAGDAVVAYDVTSADTDNAVTVLEEALNAYTAVLS